MLGTWYVRPGYPRLALGKWTSWAAPVSLFRVPAPGPRQDPLSSWCWLRGTEGAVWPVLLRALGGPSVIPLCALSPCLGPTLDSGGWASIPASSTTSSVVPGWEAVQSAARGSAPCEDLCPAPYGVRSCAVESQRLFCTPQQVALWLTVISAPPPRDGFVSSTPAAPEWWAGKEEAGGCGHFS